MPLADLVFSLCMSRVLTALDRHFDTEGLGSSLIEHDGNAAPSHHVSFIYDLAIPVISSAASMTETYAIAKGTCLCLLLLFGFLLILLRVKPRGL